MAKHVINLYATAVHPTPLQIDDGEGNSASTDQGDRNLTTLVSPGDMVVWTLSKFGGLNAITSIDNIIDKSSPVNLFYLGPVRVNDGSGDWAGIIGTFDSTTEESYSIEYTVSGVQHVQDPRLKMN